MNIQSVETNERDRYSIFRIGYTKIRRSETVKTTNEYGEDQKYKVHVVYRRCAKNSSGLYNPRRVLDIKWEDVFLDPESSFTTMCSYFRGQIDKLMNLEGRATTFDIDELKWRRLLQPEEDEPGVNFEGVPFSDSECGAWLTERCERAQKEEGKKMVLRIDFAVERLQEQEKKEKKIDKFFAAIKRSYAKAEGRAALIAYSLRGERLETPELL